MGIRDRPIALRSPWQNGYVERVIGSIRREYLDHVIVRNQARLHHVLDAYSQYYNGTRIHLGLDKDAPDRRPIEHSGLVVASKVLGGLHVVMVGYSIWNGPRCARFTAVQGA